MAARHIIAVDLAKVWETRQEKGFLRTLAWGDPVEVIRVGEDHVEVNAIVFETQEDGSSKPRAASGFIVTKKGGPKPEDVVVEETDARARVLRVNFVDVQQGDGAVIETPRGRVVLIDGGDNQLFARYLAGRFRGTTAAHPKEIDCILVTHGDADHFLGLTEIAASETQAFGPGQQWKRLFIHPQRVYHNGLVKRPSSVSEAKSLGATATVGRRTIITGLVDDPTALPDAELNRPFRAWKQALEGYQRRRAALGLEPILFRRLAQGDDDAFDFLADEDLTVEVLGPILTKADGVEGLLFLGEPPRGPRIGHPGEAPRIFRGKSASHTINGHSVILRLTFGGFRFLFAGDLNEQAEVELTRAHAAGELDLRSEVFKVPHHGSADFSIPFVQAVAPLISVVSSGDESARKEFIHPRSTLMGALGKHSRGDEPLIFVTELVAFFQVEGFVTPEAHRTKPDGTIVPVPVPVPGAKGARRFFAFSRAAFGIVKVRTDGQRLLVFTDSGQVALKEAYAFALDASGAPTPDRVLQA